MSEVTRFRLGIWAVVFFVLVVSIPGWFVQMRLLQKIGRLEKRIVQLESRIDAEPETDALPNLPTPATPELQP
jgi:hypothetical protein